MLPEICLNYFYHVHGLMKRTFQNIDNICGTRCKRNQSRARVCVTHIGPATGSLNWKQCAWKSLESDKDLGLIKVGKRLQHSS